MTALKHKQPAPSTAPTSPFDRMAETLRDDMNATNAVIIDRMQSHIPLIPQLAGYLIAAGGKRIRPLLTLASAHICDPNAKAHTLAATVEFIHTATLLHDDVVDESAQRRGLPAANLVFGNKASVLVGDFLFARAFEMMNEIGNLRILEVLSRATRALSEGEILQMALTGNLDITMQQYETIIEAKTAALFSAATHAGALAGNANDKTIEALRLYGHHLGMAFQMIDDLMDYAGEGAAMGKDAGDDFREGKLTLPVLLALAKADQSERAFWSRTLKDREVLPGDFARARDLIAKHRALESGRIQARDHATAARHALAVLPAAPMITLMDELLDFVVTRDH